MLHVRDLTRGGLARHLYHLALPIMGTSFVQMTYSFTDMAWLGRLSSESVAAVGIVSVFLWIAQSLSLFSKVGSEITIGHGIGKRQPEEARLYAQHATTLGLIIGCVTALLYGIYATPLIGLYELEGATRVLAHEYMYIVLTGIPATFLTYTLFGVYNACGNSRIPFLVLSLGLVSNMILDPVLIHGSGWGVAGAAWATVISQYLVLVVFVYRLRRHDRLLSDFSLLGRLRLNHVWRITQIGLPAAGLSTIFALITLYMGRMASSVGGHIGVATLTTGGQLEALTWNTAQGATTALGTIVAQNYAAGLPGRVLSAYRLTLLFTGLVGLLGTVLFVYAGQDIFRLIVPEPATYQAGGVYMRISGYTQVFMMVELTTQGLFNGMGRSYLPAIISIGGNLLRIVLAICLLHLGMGLEGIWWAISLSAMLKGVAAFGAFLVILVRLA